MPGIEVEPPPSGCEEYHSSLLTQGALQFVAELVRNFDKPVQGLFLRSQRRKLELDTNNSLPDFLPETKHIREDKSWRVGPLPHRLRCRHVDLGDVSPANIRHFRAALTSSAQGIQTDFDDGHCPSWTNQLRGLYHVISAVKGNLKGISPISSLPVLMLRPRAWNMPENNMLVDGKVVPGPLFDFGLLMYHAGMDLHKAESGPFFYLSKLEGYLEARLWNDVFVWAQNKLNLPYGTIRACVLIENVLASFELHEILYEMRDHSAGLNCGIWDYSASFINKFGHRPEFVLPDRNKYVNMDRHFLKSYMDLVIQTCHSRGALATGGMAAPVLTQQTPDPTEVVKKVCSGKLKEIKAGVDGFMVYDVRFVKPTQELFEKFAPTPNQIQVKRSDVHVLARDLLLMPSGGVTSQGLKHNIGVGILFILAWLRGQGHFMYKGAVEDSATAEISRSQVWQWLRHQASLEDGHAPVVTRQLIKQYMRDVINEELEANTLLKVTDHCDVTMDSWLGIENDATSVYRKQLLTAAAMFEEIVTRREFPEFITTFLYSDHTFVSSRAKFSLQSSM